MFDGTLEQASIPRPLCVLLKKKDEKPKVAPLTEEEKNALVKAKRQRPNPTPFIKVDDLNNQREQDYLDCNPSRLSVVAGLKWTF